MISFLSLSLIKPLSCFLSFACAKVIIFPYLTKSFLKKNCFYFQNLQSHYF